MNLRRTLPSLIVLTLLAACGRADARDPVATPVSLEPTHPLRSVVPSLSTVPAPCATTIDVNGTEVQLFHAAGGGCIQPDQLRAYRCGDDVDPVIEAVGLRFLGGMFAMTVPSLPAGAELLGKGGHRDIFAVPGDRPTLYVRSDGEVQRWLTLVRPPDSLPRALFLGDSITLGSRGAIVRALPGWGTGFRAQIGRTTSEGIEVARTLHDVFDQDVVVVELGTNESTAEGFPDRVRGMLDLVDPARLVVWVTVHRDLPFVPELNDDIVAAMRSLPNGAVADWNFLATPDDVISDGVHPSDRGKEVIASLLSRLLVRWHDAATGHGATACAPPAA